MTPTSWRLALIRLVKSLGFEVAPAREEGTVKFRLPLD